MPANPVTSVAPEERLVNLVVALMATRHGLTKESILASVAGYRELLPTAKKDALEKMFERDKESLRGLSIPVETIGDAADPDDLREARYRIPTSEYALPDDITFTAAEIALLNLAGGVWSESSLSGDARSGLRKLRTQGYDVDEPIIGFAPRISLRDAAFTPLQRAIEQLRVVTFDYLKPGDASARRRRIRPLRLVEYEGRWHLYGIDEAVGEPRTFLLSRIVGSVTQTKTAFAASDIDGAGEAAMAGLEALAARQHARLEVEPGSEAWLRLRRRASAASQGIDVPYVDLHVFADELASYGPEVRVVEPAALRDAVIDRLHATAERHERGTS